MSFHIDDYELLQNYKRIWSKTEEWISVGHTALPGHDDKYIKTKMKTYSNKTNTDHCDLGYQKME